MIPYRSKKEEGTDYRDLPVSDLRRSLVRAAIDLYDHYPTSEEQDYLTNLPDDQVLPTFARFEQMARKKYGRQFKQFLHYYVDKPIVDYIRVEPEYRRQGIGTALYRAAQKWLHDRGMKLYASGLQSDEAKAAWKNMRKQWPVKAERGTMNRRRYRRRYFAG